MVSQSNIQRIAWLDMLRGFAMACVIIAHPINIPSDIEMWIYSFHMPLFFMISGATFRYNKYDSFAQCCRDQAKRLLIPYVVMYVVCVPFWILNRRILEGSDTSPWNLIIGFLTANESLGTMSNGALWFLPALFLTSVTYWLLTYLHEHGKVNIAGSIAVCFLLGLFLTTCIDAAFPWHIQCIPMITVFYFMGHAGMTAIRDHQATLASIGDSAVAALCVALLAAGTWAAFDNGKISVHSNSYGTLALALIGIVGISGGLTLMFMRLPVIKPLDFIGKQSIIFLGYHVPVMRFFEFCPVTADFSEHNSLWLSMACIVILFPIAYLIDRFAPFLAGKIRRRR